MDGSEQRFRGYQTPLRRWAIRLDLLDQTELHILREFFLTQNGSAGSFSFTDPWDGTVYPNCSLDEDEMAEKLEDVEKGKTTLTVCGEPKLKCFTILSSRTGVVSQFPISRSATTRR